MSTRLQRSVQTYLDERRQLGFDLAGGTLMRFARYADARNHRGPLTLDLQLDWAREHVHRTGPVTWARRLEIVRPFAAYYQQFEPDSAIPDPHTFGPGHRRLAPHIYTPTEIGDLLEAAGHLTPIGGLRPATYQSMFGLIASTGLRLSEALHLKVDDLNLRDGILTVRQTKFNKSRRLPMHPSTVEALQRYGALRDHAVSRKPNMSFFVSTTGDELSKRTVHKVFERLRKQLAWTTARGGHARPRIHDLRHTFAVRRVQLWHESNVTIDHGMFWLCTYLGHAKISDTYWYLTGVPELMSVIGAQFEGFVLNQEATYG
jgi:integrase